MSKKTINIEIDCQDKTCTPCIYQQGNPPYCVLFDVYLKDEIVDTCWIVYRCKSCLLAQKKEQNETPEHRGE